MLLPHLHKPLFVGSNANSHSTNMKIFGLLLSLFVTQICLAQFKLTKLDKNSIPKNIQYSGSIIQAVRWTDNIGDNILFSHPTSRKAKMHLMVGTMTEFYTLITI